MNIRSSIRVGVGYAWIIPAVIFLMLRIESSYGQETALAHSMQEVLAHNDYQKPKPFYNAYKYRVGIIEADLFYHNGQVLVAHDDSELHHKWNLEKKYIIPIRNMVKRYGNIYPDSQKSLALMLDIKNHSTEIMEWILRLVDRYPDLFGRGTDKPKLALIISGHRPPIDSWSDLPPSVYIDGRLSDQIPENLRYKVYMVSSSLSGVIPGSWSGEQLPPSQIQVLRNTIDGVHEQGLKIRFWGVPDNVYFWQLQIQLGIDIIGSDQLDELSQYISR